MELQWFFRALRRQWYLVLIPVVIVGAFVAYDLLTAPPAAATGYTTVVRFSIAPAADALQDREGDYQDVWLSSELAVLNVTEWILTTSFKREVAERAAEQDVSFRPEALPTAADHVRSVGQMFISWQDADELEVIAAAALDTLREESHLYFSQFGGEPATVTVLDDVQITPQPPPVLDLLGPVVQVGLAIIVGLGLAALAEYFDPMLRTRDEIERYGIEVLVSIPRD